MKGIFLLLRAHTQMDRYEILRQNCSGISIKSRSWDQSETKVRFADQGFDKRHRPFEIELVGLFDPIKLLLILRRPIERLRGYPKK